MNRVKAFSVRPGVILVAVGLALLAHAEVRGDDWVFYGGSREETVEGSTLRDWYVLNKLGLAPKAEATAYHYYDRDSAASNSPFPGGIVRVWEKFVFQKVTNTYDEAREDIEKEEGARLKRKIGPLDYGWLFLFATNRATKEVATLYEINCDSHEFFILEVNHYDKAGKRMTRETNSNPDLWFPIRTETMLELLSKEVCK